jgi:riboflavin biosynthesis pyrimidine reductase
VEARFEPAEVRRLIQRSDRDLSIGGPTLTSAAFAAGLVDEVWLFAVPVAVGGGTPAFPLGQRQQLELLDEHRFRGGTVALHYATAH